MIKMTALTILAALALLPTAPAAALDADQLIASHVAARGGAEALRTLRSIRRQGHLIIPGANFDISASTVVVRGGGVRNEFTLQGLTQINAYDGKEAWKVDPFEGRKDPERMSADESKPLLLQADIDSPLVDYKSKGHSVEYLGLDDIDGTPAHKLRVHLKSGDEVVYYIDPDSYMIIRDVQKQLVRGAEQETETDYGEYEKAGGVYVPMAEDSGPKNSDSAHKQQLVFDSVEANGPAEPAQFAFPVRK
jgi:hypothetical protein